MLAPHCKQSVQLQDECVFYAEDTSSQYTVYYGES